MIWFIIAGVFAVIIGVFAWALCAAAGNADAHLDAFENERHQS